MILCMDWGASLVKIIKAGTKSLVSSESFRIEEYIAGVDDIRATGIRSAGLPETIDGIRVKKFEEFEIIADAIGQKYGGLAVSIGTGTSIVDTEKRMHVGGTGIGGGTIMGLCSKLIGKGTFEEYERMALEGNRRNVDLLVEDMCERIGDLDGSVTASNLSRMTHKTSPKDAAAGVFNLVGEVIGTVSSLALKTTGLSHITFLGSTTRSEAIKRTLTGVCAMYGCRSVFSKDPVFEIAEALSKQKD